MTVHPLSRIAAAVCLGIAAAARIKQIFFWPCFAAAVILFLCACFLPRRRFFHAALFSLCFLLGVLLLLDRRALAGNHLLRVTDGKRKEVSLMGIVADDPQPRGRGASFLLDTDALKMEGSWYKVNGRVLVRAGRVQDIHCADSLLLHGVLRRPFFFNAPAGRRRNNYLAGRGIYFIFRPKKENTLVKIDSRRKGNFVLAAIYGTRRRLKDITAHRLSPLAASLLNALILGLRQELPASVRDALVNTGTVHIIAISGLHMGIFCLLVLISLKAMRLPRYPRYWAAVIALWAYCLLTGSNLPAVRAAIMATVFIAGVALRRQYDITGSLSLAALIILFMNPSQLFEASFQLSFMSIISLVYLAPRIEAFFLRRCKIKGRAAFLVKLFSSSLAAWVGLLPFVLYYFKTISPVAIIANMVVVPYMAVVVACAAAMLFFGLFLPLLAPVFAASAEISILALLRLILLLEKLPFGHFRIG